MEKLHFGWDGAAACPGTLSPDGRYAAVEEGGPYFAGKSSIPPPENPWPSVVVLDADTCAPIFRVRSAHMSQPWESAHMSKPRGRSTGWLSPGWLSTSGGAVVGVRGGYEIARVRPAPEIREVSWGAADPAPAPTGGGRYFGFGARVYDAAKDRWYGMSNAFAVRGSTGAYVSRLGFGWWGDSHRERWFGLSAYANRTSPWYLLLPPKIEYPPFSDEIAFRVARTGSCLRLREEPGEGGRVLRCLPDGVRLLFAERDAEVPESDRLRRAFLSPFLSPHSSLSLPWVHVRTADGAEGWVSHDYLDHD